YNMVKFDFIRKKSFAIDLGNTNTLVHDADRLLVDQPSYIVLDSNRSAVKAVGHEAYSMYEKTHNEYCPVKPLKGGVIADYDSAAKMLQALMLQAYGDKSVLNGYGDIISGVPYSTTAVERRALLNALETLHARNTYLLFEPIAAALGMGLNIQEPEGKLVIDIGGGITEIVVISLSGIACFQSIKVAGDSMDETIRHYFRKEYNMAIGIKTAEQVKIQVGAVMADIENPPKPMAVKGKELLRGLPVTRTVDHVEIASVLEKSMSAIELGLIQTLETCPPELASDIYVTGVHVTGGNALLRGLPERLQRKLKLPVHVDDTPLQSVSKGVAAVLRDPKKYRGVLMQ
ncbi:MAG TPA: rod shape-determining protein, partial [Chryseosolibacter sp.]|nr:rod shape-determining protein [Chryseosolibacter sp.]